MAARILGISGHLPSRVETNEDLAREHPAWDLPKIAAKTGILARHIAADDETSCDLGCRAAEKLMARELVPAASIDYIIFSTQTPDYVLPSNATQLQHRLKLANHVGAIDISPGCAGFVLGLQLANGLIESRAARNVLLVTAETYSKLVHPSDRTVRTLFGDCLFMDGQAVFAFTLNVVPAAIAQLLEKSQLKSEAIDWYVFHQANKFMLDSLAKCSRIPADKMVFHLDTVGNTVSASIPLAIEAYVESGKIRAGQKLVIAGFGVGLTWALCTLTWS
jgi:3-oxoacyl-[acyl-carrier-protein] synthase-3